MKEKILTMAKMRKHSAFIKPESKPILRHQTEGFHCAKAEIRAVGTVELNGEHYHFNDIRVYLKEGL